MKQNSKQNMIVMALVIAIVTGGAGFFAGTKYQQSKRPSFSNGMGGLMGQNGINGQNRTGSLRGGFKPVAGEIVKVDDSSITVKLTDGSSKIVMLSQKTSINKAELKTKSDLIVGTQVAVFGSENSDGSLTAQNVQIDPTRMGVENAPSQPK